MRNLSRPLICALLVSFSGLSCTSTPHQGGLYRLEPARSACSRAVQLFTLAQVVPSHHELRQLSATCPYLAPTTCERVLLARGCELGADAIVINATRTIGRKGKPQLADEAVAIRFDP